MFPSNSYVSNEPTSNLKYWELTVFQKRKERIVSTEKPPSFGIFLHFFAWTRAQPYARLETPESLLPVVRPLILKLQESFSIWGTFNFFLKKKYMNDFFIAMWGYKRIINYCKLKKIWSITVFKKFMCRYVLLRKSYRLETRKTAKWALLNWLDFLCGRTSLSGFTANYSFSVRQRICRQ